MQNNSQKNLEQKPAKNQSPQEGENQGTFSVGNFLSKNRLFLIIGMAVLLLAFSFGGFWFYQNQSSQSDVPHYFIAIHLEPNHGPKSEKNIEKQYSTLKNMIAKADDYNIKLTLMFTPQWADYIAKSSERMEELQEWKEKGHEISAHHHSIYHGNWDGYTDFPKEKTIKERKKRGKNEKYLGTLDDYIEKIKQINPDINSGCMNEEPDKDVMPEEIIYPTCSGYANFGDAEKLDDQYAEKGRNDFVLVGEVDGIERKWLAHTHIITKDKMEKSRDAFESINSGVFGVVTHGTSNGEQDLYYYDFIEFLHENDPKGEKSMTLTEVIESDILPHKELELNDVAMEDECDLNNDGVVDKKEKKLCDKESHTVDKHQELSDSEIPYYSYFMHIDPIGAQDGADLSNRFKTVEERVEYANNYNIKLSLWFGHAHAEWIAGNEEAMKTLGEWVEQGHEIGIHHHSLYKTRNGEGVQNQWDGYTSLPKEEAIQERTAVIGNELDIERWGYLGNLDDYMEVFHVFEEEFGIDVNLGIANEQSNKTVSMPDELIYSAGSGFVNNGEPGRWQENDSKITKGINEFISTAEVNGIERKWLTHYTITNPEYEEKAEKLIPDLDQDTVFIGVAHNFNDLEVFKDYMDFLHGIDPDASKNLVMQEVMEGDILEEKEIDLRCEEQDGIVCPSLWGDRTCPAGDWLINEDNYQCCSEPCPSPLIILRNSVKPTFLRKT